MTIPSIATGRKVRLRHMQREDLPALHRMVTSPGIRDTWRTRGDLWSFGRLEQRLVDDPHLGLVVTELDADEPLGLFELHDVDLVDARAQLAVLVAQEAWCSGVAGEGAVLFARHAFESLPLEKLACTVQATNDRAVPALRRVLAHEGTLRRHLNIHGTWVDVEVFALWKAALPGIEERLGLTVLGPSRPEGFVTMRSALERVLVESGLGACDLATVTFGDLDSLAALEILVEAEEFLGRALALEAISTDLPVGDLLALAGEAADTRWS